MKILLNNKVTVIDDDLTIKKLLEQVDISNKYFAIEVNEQVVPKSSHKSFPINEGDKIEIITAIGGG